MLIRDESPSDIQAIDTITRAAFAHHPYSRQTEQFIVKALRAAGALAVSLVAEEAGEVVGHIAFSRVSVPEGGEGWYGLGPVSVAPACQRRGIGSALVREGLARLNARQAAGCILVGDPGFYRRFGFSALPGLVHAGVPDENVLALRFGVARPRGAVTFHPAFWATA